MQDQDLVIALILPLVKTGPATKVKVFTACFPASKTGLRVPQCWLSGTMLEFSISSCKHLAHYFLGGQDLPETCLISRSLDLPHSFVFSLGWLSPTSSVDFSASFGRDTCPCKMRLMNLTEKAGGIWLCQQHRCFICCLLWKFPCSTIQEPLW